MVGNTADTKKRLIKLRYSLCSDNSKLWKMFKSFLNTNPSFFVLCNYVEWKQALEI